MHTVFLSRDMGITTPSIWWPGYDMKPIKRIKKIEEKIENEINSLTLAEIHKISVLISKIVKNAYVQGVIDGSSETQKRLTKK